MKINGQLEQILFYLYDLRETPERGVGPDPRLMAHGISEGTQLPINIVNFHLQLLIENAFVRPLLVGRKTYHYITYKGTAQVEKTEERSFKVGVEGLGLNLGYKKSENKGIRS